jgi:hypothetical protein
MKWFREKYKLKTKPEVSPLERAIRGEYKLIDYGNITEKEFAEVDANGNTMLHHMLLHSMHTYAEGASPPTEAPDWHIICQEIPQDLITPAVLSRKNNRGECPWLYLASKGSLASFSRKEITKEILLEASNQGETPLMFLIMRHQLEFLDPKLMEEGILLENCKIMNSSYLHYCALNGELNKVPQHLWLDKLDLLDGEGNTLLHWLLEGDWEGLKVLPTDKKTIELLTHKNARGETPMHHTTKFQNLPEEYLKEENLCAQDALGLTPLHRSVLLEGTTYLPINKLNENILLTKTNDGEYLIQTIGKMYQPQRDKENMIKILKLLCPIGLSVLNSAKTHQEALKLTKEEVARKRLRKELKNSREESLEL